MAEILEKLLKGDEVCYGAQYVNRLIVIMLILILLNLIIDVMTE